MVKIRLLDEHCINQIAAGEVVERPLSIVKELVENAVDAGAGKIEISVAGGGVSYIQVKDDGSGMSAEDLKLAVLPHATSKISKIDDLDNLSTLGFRGEALSSIAAVSKLSILSRVPEEVSGYEIRLEGGKTVSFSESGCPSGTTVTVQDLFFNTPVRLKFLRSANTEFGLISDMVGKLALANPHIAFSLRHPRNMVMNTPGQGNLLDTVAAVLGNDVARKMLPLSFANGDFQLSGYVSSPELARTSRYGTTFIVNGRVVRSPVLSQALKEAYHTLIPAGTFPLAVINLRMPPNAYDVNVHPAKLEIKFKAERELVQEISATIRNTLLKAKPVSSMPLYPQKISAAPQTDWQQLKILYRPNTGNWESPLRESPEIKLAPPAPPEIKPEAEGLGSSRLDFSQLRAVGQLFNTYVLCTDENAFYMIDQHAAHERIRYDELMRQMQKEGVSSQMLLVPETVELTLQEEQVLLEYFEDFHALGFVVEHFGERTYFLRAVPVLNDFLEPAQLFRQYLMEILQKSFTPTRERLLEKWIDMIACRTAIKGNETLSAAQMDELIQVLGDRANPLSCPHGRPTIIRVFSKKDLENRFGR